MKFQTTTQVLFNVLANLLALPHHEKFMQELYLLMMVSNYIVGEKSIFQYQNWIYMSK